MEETPPPPTSNPTPPPPPATRALALPVTKPSPPKPSPKTDHRREFFNDAMRETLGPLAGMLEAKIQPMLAALESIPDEAERIAKTHLGVILDQPQHRDAAAPVDEPVEELRWLRPPGAMPPGEFESVCSACGKCVDACPAQAIKMDPRGLVADGLPYIVAAEQPCVISTDLACMSVCPTGALKLMDRFHLQMGTAAVDHLQCLRDHGEDCRLCVEACPITGEGTSPHGDAIFINELTGRVRVRFDACVGCGLCENRCPTEPRAITVRPYKKPVDPIVA